MSSRYDTALVGFDSTIIQIDTESLGRAIADHIVDVGQLNVVSSSDLQVYSKADGSAPKNVSEAIATGTKFFDAILYIALDATLRPGVIPPVGKPVDLEREVVDVKRHLLWLSIFLMLRGNYPVAQTATAGTDIPSFLVNICGMNVSPRALGEKLASFDLKGIPMKWVKGIDWRPFAPEIKQRLALGLAGYRMLGPFKYYSVRPDATDEVKAAVNWVKAINSQPYDYALLSCTRSASVVQAHGSLNRALGCLMIEAFTPAQIQEMVNIKMIFVAPVRDVRSNAWKTWATSAPMTLNDPILLD